MLGVCDAIVGFPCLIVDLAGDGASSAIRFWQDGVVNIQDQRLIGIGELGAHTDSDLIGTSFFDRWDFEEDCVASFPSVMIYMLVVTIALLPLASAKRQEY